MFESRQTIIRKFIMLLCSLSIAVIFLLFSAIEAVSGILVSPTVVFISDKSPTSRITLLNQGSKPQEVNIRFSFGLPESDSLGNISVTFQDSAVTDPRSALGWVKAFPKRVIVEPGKFQIVRLMVKAPKNLANGEYWTRIMVQSKDAIVDVPDANQQDKIITQLNMITEMAIMLKYRTGDLSSNIDLKNAKAELKDSTVEVMFDLVNRGNISYMGMLNCRLLDRDNNEISSSLRKLAVYRDIKRRIVLDYKDDNYNQPFSVEIKIESEGRNDVAPEDMIYGNRIVHTVAVK